MGKTAVIMQAMHTRTEDIMMKSARFPFLSITIPRIGDRIAEMKYGIPYKVPA